MRFDWDAELQVTAINIEEAWELINKRLEPLEELGIVVALMDTKPHETPGLQSTQETKES